MTAELAPLSRKTSSPRVRLASDAALTRLSQGVPVLDFKCRTSDMGRRAKNFTEHVDHELVGQYKRAAYELDGVLVFLQLYRETDDGTMTLFVDLGTCVQRLTSPLALASRVLEGLGLDACEKVFVHTKAEELFWQRVDPILVARKLRGTQP